MFFVLCLRVPAAADFCTVPLSLSSTHFCFVISHFYRFFFFWFSFCAHASEHIFSSSSCHCAARALGSSSLAICKCNWCCANLLYSVSVSVIIIELQRSIHSSSYARRTRCIFVGPFGKNQEMKTTTRGRRRWRRRRRDSKRTTRRMKKKKKHGKQSKQPKITSKWTNNRPQPNGIIFKFMHNIFIFGASDAHSTHCCVSSLFLYFNYLLSVGRRLLCICELLSLLLLVCNVNGVRSE